MTTRDNKPSPPRCLIYAEIKCAKLDGHYRMQYDQNALDQNADRRQFSCQSIDCEQSTGRHKNYLLEGQLFLTAGPRKDRLQDTELGEDAGGIVLRNEACYFWIADGTSEGGFDDFTPRVLAQDLGSFFSENVRKNNPATSGASIEEVFNNVLQQTLDLWNELLLSKNGPEMPKSRDGITVSSVFLCGWLTKERQLRVITYGDAFAIACSAESKIQQIENNQYRFFLRLSNRAEGDNEPQWTFQTTKNHKLSPTLIVNDVEQFVCGSDGASKIKYYVRKSDALPLVTGIRGLLRSLQMESFDDKTICVVRAFPE